jgi:2-oxoacid:acceptor oxidoreductase gamma subunit (pyruvate/2-ketoisovalerate family)
VRLDDQPMDTHQAVVQPDVVIVMDHHLFGMMNPAMGLKPDGRLIVNCKEPAANLPAGLTDAVQTVYTIDATGIAHELYGQTTIPITNIIIVGAYCAAEKDVSVSSVASVLPDFFAANRVDVNERAVKMGYESVEVYHG